MRRLPIIFALVGVSSLAGCAWSEKIEGKVAPDTVSVADRCGAVMQTAMPFAQINLDERTSRSPDVRTIITTVTGTRQDIAKDAAGGPDLAAECTFVDNVLTGFRWTKGGPPPPIGNEPPPPAGETPPGSQTPPKGPAPSQAGKTPPSH